jgi:hypothetical protein
LNNGKSTSQKQKQWGINKMKAPWRSNIKFLANYIFNNPGCTGTEARKALCKNNEKEWTNATEMRGQYTTYFSQGWIGGRSWPVNPCGRYWTRVKRADGRTGHLVTCEGMMFINA